jgi:hypothetical protein
VSSTKQAEVNPSSNKHNKCIIHGALSLTHIMDEVIGNFPTTIGESSKYVRKKFMFKQ